MIASAKSPWWVGKTENGACERAVPVLEFGSGERL
jgi:hypothetical protein